MVWPLRRTQDHGPRTSAVRLDSRSLALRMTYRLYYNDAYLTDFDATLVEVADDGRRVYLDRTAFYPTSGGQPFDTGTLGGRRVVDVVDEETRIAHLLDGPLEAKAGRVPAHVDWPRRFDHMQQHTGQHLLSAVLENLFGWRTVSVHFGDTVSTLDVDADAAPHARLVAAEDRANLLIAENRPVTVAFENAEEAMGLRKATGRTGEIRVVSIAEVDRSACGGTHVRATAEIGVLLIRRTERVKQGTRIEFVCGLRAASRARADYDALASIAQGVSSAVDDAAGVVNARLAAGQEAEAARRKAARELDGYHARERVEAAVPDARGVRRVVERRAGGTLDDLKGLAHAVCAHPRSAFIGAIESAGGLLVGTSEDSGLAAGSVLRAAVEAAGRRVAAHGAGRRAGG